MTYFSYAVFLASMSLFNLNGFAQTVVVTNPTSPWTVPAGVTSIKAEVWGGGGAGGGCNSALVSSYGSGGGGGAYNVSTFSVSSGQTYTILIGAGGTGSPDANGTDGTASSVSGPGGSVSANPGSGGARRGGQAGKGGTGGFNSGGQGGSATSNGAGGGGGAGNASPAGTGTGGDGSNNTAGSAGAGALPGGAGGAFQNSNGTGNAGAPPGGGGGGGYQLLLNGDKTGGAGASGQVVITYTPGSGPTITGFSPVNACTGSAQPVRITGTNFTGATAVTFYNGQSALFTVNSATQITATLPAGATTGPISVTTPSGTGTSSGSFTVNALPAAPVPGKITQPTCVISTGSVVLNGLPATGTWTLTRTPGGTTTQGSGTSTTISGLSAGSYTFTVTRDASGCISPASSNIAINTQPVTPVVPDQTSSVSSGVMFTVTPVGATIPAGTTYTWTAPIYTGGVTGGSAQTVPQTNISGTLSVPFGSGTATYTVTPTSGDCVGAIFKVTVTVTSSCQAVTIGTQPVSDIICATTGNTSFTIIAGGTAPFTYQWQYLNGNTWAAVRNGTPSGALYTNATTSTLNVSGITSAGIFQYRCYITNCSGGYNATSSAVNLTVNALPIPTLVSSDANNTFCSGTSITFTAGGGTSYNFRVGGISVQNGVSATYTTSTLTNRQVVDVIVTNAAGCTATSAGITNTVNALPVPTLTSSDANNTFCSGTSITFTAGGGTGYNFRVGGISVQNGVSATYTTNSLTNGQAVDVIVTNAAGCTATSAAITNTVNALPVPTLTSSDADNIFCAGTSIIFTAGGGTSYNFRAGGISVQNGVSATYTTSTLTNGQAVDVIVTNAAGCTATSAAIKNTVNALPLPTLTSSDADNIFCSGTSVTFTAGGGTVYNFRVGGVSAQNGALSTFTTNSLTNGQLVDVIVTNASGCTATSAGITNTVITIIPTLSSSDANNVFCFGTRVTFTAGGGTNFNFMVGGITVQNSTSPTYTTTTLTNGQIVTAIVSNTIGCSATSPPIQNIVNPLPFIILSTPTTCSIDYSTYSIGVTVPSSGIVTSTAGTVTNTGGGIWTITRILSGTNITVKVADSGGCENTLSVTAPNCSCPVVLPPVSGGDKSYCAGGVIPALTATVLTGETVDWYSTSSGGAPLMSGSLSYTPTAPGTYYALTRNTTSSCVSGTRTPVILTMNPLPTPTLTSSEADNIFCTGTSVIFTAGGGTGFNFRAGGISIQNGVSATYTTSTLTNGQVIDVIVTNAAGCTATSAAITNTVNALPVPTLTSSDADNKICAGTSVTFTGGGGTGYNFRAGGLSVQNGASPTYTTSSLTNGQVVDVIVTNANGCTATSAGITNSVYVIPIANAGTGGNNCGLAFHLNGSLNIGTGTWAKVSGPGNVTFTPDANTATAIVTVTAFGTYTFSWTVVNGACSNNANVTVAFIQQPAANAGSGGDVCTNNFIFNAVATTGTGTWTKVTGPGNAIFTPDAHQANAKVTVDKFGVYDFAWTVINSTCTSIGGVRLVFHDLPLINAGKDSTICKGGSIQLQALGSGSVTWVPATLVSNPNIINPIATPDTTTTFTVNLTDQYGCKNSDNIVIGVRDRLIADAGPDQVLGYVFTTTMDAKLAHSYEKGVWRVISGTGEFVDSTYTLTAVSNLSVGTNEFLWTVTNGFCPPSYDTILIEVNNFVIPTLITPNMDGRNDYFILKGLTTLGKTELVIFDRKGTQVYKNMNYDNSWNGVDYNKNPLPDDTYFYVLKNGKGKSYRGYVVIRR